MWVRTEGGKLINAEHLRSVIENDDKMYGMWFGSDESRAALILMASNEDRPGSMNPLVRFIAALKNKEVFLDFRPGPQ